MYGTFLIIIISNSVQDVSVLSTHSSWTFLSFKNKIKRLATTTKTRENTGFNALGVALAVERTVVIYECMI